MSVNKYSPHVLVLPEDDANRQIANGFHLDHGLATRKMQVLEEAGGWLNVLNRFAADHVLEMRRYPNRYMVLLLDSDGQPDRLDKAREAIPDDLKDRVFVLGARNEPEELRQDLGSYEKIGLGMARDCRDSTDGIWAHPLLCHNVDELERLRNHVRTILFPQTA